MNLSVIIEKSVLNIRVAVILKNSSGYLFEKSKKGYIYLVGGRIKLGESSQEAALREVMEELNTKVDKIKLRSVIENFFSTENGDVHELCFVYEAENEFAGDLPKGFISVSKDDLESHDIRPSAISDILKDENKSFKHIVHS